MGSTNLYPLSVIRVYRLIIHPNSHAHVLKVMILRPGYIIFLDLFHPKDHWTLKIGYFEDQKTPASYRFVHPSIGGSFGSLGQVILILDSAMVNHQPPFGYFYWESWITPETAKS